MHHNAIPIEPGAVYNYWTVLSPLYARSKSGQLMWLCRCRCGNERHVESYSLRSGKTKSCGCIVFKHGAHRTPEGRLWMCARQRARKRGVEFSISPSDIRIPSLCPLLGIPIVVSTTQRNTKAARRDKSWQRYLYNENRATVDRIDSQKGYTPDNIWVISDKANRIKTDAALKELKTVAFNWERLSVAQ